YCPYQGLALDHRRGAASALPDAHPRPYQAVEAEPNGPRVKTSLGGIHEGEGSDARADPHSRSALVGRGGRRQEEGPVELHPPSAGPDPLWRGRSRADCAAPPHSSRRLHSRPGTAGDVRSSRLLNVVGPPLQRKHPVNLSITHISDHV